MELNEIKKALEEVVKAKEKSVYRLSGTILIKVGVTELRKDFEDKESMISLRLKTLDKQEAKLKEKIDELRTRMIKVKPSIGKGSEK